MMKRSIVAVLAAALTLSACGDSTAPDPIQLTEAQAEDMMEALGALGSFTGGGAGFRKMAAYNASNTALLTSTIDATEPCPNGGNQRIQATANINDAGTQMTMGMTQTFQACKATSEAGTLWTFNGAPNLVTNFTMSYNQSTGISTISATQAGAIDASSSVGSGRCSISVTLNFSSNENTGAFNGSISGTVCGVSVTQTIDYAPGV